jgi:7,8-dihydroneopterin 2',3'-cyclic phosphate phosphodiesterase
MERRELLLGEVKSIEDEELRNFVREFLEDPRITFTDVEALITFEESPASPRSHHSYPGGLIDHTIGVKRVAESLANDFSSTYGFNVERDYVIAGSLLHDVLKYYQYRYDEITGGFRQREDWYLAHDFSIVAELSYRGADSYLIRVISEAHGFNVVATPEGQIIHLADETDAKFASKLQDVVFRACVDIERETDGKVLAIKLFHSLMRNYTVFDLVPYIRGGSDELRNFIKTEMGIEE